MSGLARLSLQQLARAAAVRPTAALASAPVASTSTLGLGGRPLRAAGSVRLLSTSTVLAAKGQGGREVKAKKAPKAQAGKGGKGKSKAVEEEDEDEDDFDWGGGGKKAPRRTNEPNEADVIEAEVVKAEDKMVKAVAWFADKYGENVARIRGQVSTSASSFTLRRAGHERQASDPLSLPRAHPCSLARQRPRRRLKG
jgi:hypothetical protein